MSRRFVRVALAVALFGASVAALTLVISSVFLAAYVYLGAGLVLKVGLGGLAVVLALRKKPCR